MRAVRVLVTLLLFMPLVLPAGQAVAGLPETPHPRQMSVADGLPSNRINAVTEDRQGYLWIATSDGLARYDGIGYRIWRGEQGLRDSFIWSVHVDARNRLWIGTGNAGLAVLDADRRGFRYYNQANSPAMGSDTVWSVASTPRWRDLVRHLQRRPAPACGRWRDHALHAARRTIRAACRTRR